MKGSGFATPLHFFLVILRRRCFLRPAPTEVRNIQRIWGDKEATAPLTANPAKDEILAGSCFLYFSLLPFTNEGVFGKCALTEPHKECRHR